MYAKQEGSRQPGTEPAEKVRDPMNRERRTPKDDVKDTGRFFSLGCVISQALMEIHCHGHPQKGPVHFLIPWTLQAYYPGSKGRAAATDNPPNLILTTMFSFPLLPNLYKGLLTSNKTD